jgi:hypothetical protein
MKLLDSFFFLSEKKFFLKKFFLALKKNHLVLFFSFLNRSSVSFSEFARIKALVFPGVFLSSLALTKICSGQTLLVSSPKSGVPFLQVHESFLLLGFVYKKRIFPSSFIKWFYLFSGCSNFSYFFRFFFLIFYLNYQNVLLG